MKHRCRSSRFRGLVVLLIVTIFTGLGRSAEPVVVHVSIDPQTVLGHIPENFLGFGYESSAVAQSGFFSAKNGTMVKLYQNLTPHGLIRIGGNVSDHTMYAPDGTPAVNAQDEVTVLNRAGLTELGEFARASGWSVMWGLNLGTGTKEQAADEAVAVDRALGSSLQSFQIGNEVDFLPNFKHKYEGYHTAWLDYKAAVRAKLPHAVFSGPDVASSLPIFEQFVTDESADMALATYHYYRTDVSNPKATMDYLLTHDDPFDQRLDRLRSVCESHRVGFRINEVNSFSGGGKPGVSDTFASALWVLDYNLTLAAHGCSGVNIQTDINHRAFISHYSPIIHDEKMVCSTRPEYYGLLAFAMASHGDVIKASSDADKINLAIHATADMDKKTTWLVVINKDLTADVEIRLPVTGAAVSVHRLQAPSMDSKSGVTFAGSTVADDGSWSPGQAGQITARVGEVKVDVPHASAVVIRVPKS